MAPPSVPGKHSTRAGASTSEAFLEELIIRRELARNFTWFHPDGYDGWAAVPEWAQDSLLRHEDDARPQLYTLRQLEQGDTSDAHWNAAQWQMLITGHMHNYMRCACCLSTRPALRCAVQSPVAQGQGGSGRKGN